MPNFKILFKFVRCCEPFVLMLACLIVFCVPANAQQLSHSGSVRQFEAGHTYFKETLNIPYWAHPDLEFDYKWSFRVLLSEPVVFGTIRWGLGPTIPLPETSAKGISFIRTDSVPEPILARVKLISAKLQAPIQFWDSVRFENYYLEIDVGSAKGPVINWDNADSNDWSFNVSGSPAWKSTLFQATHNLKNRTLWRAAISEQKAREFFSTNSFREPSEGWGVTNLIDVEIDYGPVWDWWEKTQLLEARGYQDSSKTPNEETSQQVNSTFSDGGLDTDLSDSEEIQSSLLSSIFATRKEETLSRHHKSRLLLLFDVSGSMTGSPLVSAQRAAIKVAETSVSSGGEIAVFAFSGSCDQPITAKLDFSSDLNTIKAFISSLETGGGTPLATALLSASEYISQAPKETRNATGVVLLADGSGDETCGSIPSTLGLMESRDSLFEHQSVGLNVENNTKAIEQLEQIAVASGGELFLADDNSIEAMLVHALEKSLVMSLIGNFGSSATEESQQKTSATNRVWEMLNEQE